jgi:hypothetical protein
LGGQDEAMMGPAHRPPAALRAFAALLGVAALLFNAALMLSDRAPGALRTIGGDFVRRLSERIDTDGRAAQVLNDPRLPESDTIVHVAVWAVAVTLVGWALWSWIGLLAGAVAVFAASLVVEAAQGRLTDTRAVEASDVSANLTGVVLGVVFVALCYLLYSALAHLFASSRTRGYPVT